MIRKINNDYQDLRVRTVKWKEDAAEFHTQVNDLAEQLKQPFDMKTLLEMAKFAEALPSEIRDLKLKGTSMCSHVNGEIFNRYVRVRSNNGFVSIGVLNRGRDLVTRYLDLIELMIQHTVEELNKDRTQTNAHKALCLSRDIARFTSYVNDGVYRDIIWEQLEPAGDYLDGMFPMEAIRKELEYITVRGDTTKGIGIWNLEWDTERLGFALNALQSLIERITIFGVTRLGMTPEELDAVDPE